MAISEAKRAEIISFSGKMSVREIADKVGVPRSTVARVLSSGAKSSTSPVPKPRRIPARTHTHDDEDVSHSVPLSQSVPSVPSSLSPTMIAEVALSHLLSEIALYDEALAEKSSEDEKVRSMAEWKVVNHEKLVQSALRTLAQWFGMDKGDVLKALEEIRHDPFATMSKEELLALYEVTR